MRVTSETTVDPVPEGESLLGIGRESRKEQKHGCSKDETPELLHVVDLLSPQRPVGARCHH
jgi:hypothetical protein